MLDSHPDCYMVWEYSRCIPKQRCSVCENSEVWLLKATREVSIMGKPDKVSHFAVECSGPRGCYIRGPLARSEESALMAWTKLNYS